jgi:hypothetical protein
MTLVLSLVLAAGVVPLQDAYRAAREYDRAGFRYRPPDAAQLERARRLLSTLARDVAPGVPPQALVAQAREAGFALIQGRDEAGELWIVHELEGQRAGAGFYALRPGGLPVCIQAPHTFFDQGTGEIALATFAALRASCLCTNTVHRREVDVAHAERSVFLSATEGLLEARGWPLVQLHGFGQGSLPSGVAAVVSEGLGRTGAGARLQAALQLDAGRVLLHPRDTRELGGTTNVEGASAGRAGARFLHVELSAEARRTLRADPRPLVSALREALTAP